MVLKENNQLWAGVVQSNTTLYRPKVNYLPATACPEVFYLSYTKEIHKPDLSIVKTPVPERPQSLLYFAH